MTQGIFTGTALPVLEQLVGFAQARHQVLAGNLANIDTPGYRTRDLSVPAFQQQLKRAIETRDRAPVAGEAPVASQRRVALDEARPELSHILYHDQSNVGLEQQVAELSKNQMQHNLALSIMGSQFRLLQTAISERV